jgi:cell division protein FtsA
VVLYPEEVDPMNRTRLAAIDIGRTKVCALMADVNAGGDLRITGVGTALIDSDGDGLATHNCENVITISKAVKTAEKMAGYRLTKACVNISDKAITSINSRGVISVSHSDQVVRIDDQKRVLEMAQNIEIQDDQRLIHIIPHSITLDGQTHIENPIGMRGFRLQVDTHLVTAPTESIEARIKCLASLGIDTDSIVLNSLASSEAVLDETEKARGVALADIGGVTTDFALFQDGNVKSTATIPVGGYHITNDIALGLRMELETAEAMKRQYNCIASEGTINEEFIAVDGQLISYQVLHEITEARLDELFHLILLQIPRDDLARTIPSGLVITGGGSNMSGIAAFGRKLLHLPVKVGIPQNPDGFDDIPPDPTYATSLGLIYWRIKAGNMMGNNEQDGLRTLLRKGLAQIYSRK